MDIFDLLVNEELRDYKCFDLLKELLKREDFYQIIKEGIIKGEISGFTDELWKKIKAQNVRVIDNFEQVFVEGFNIGACTNVSRQLSFSFDSCFICGGTLSIIAGTKNSVDGRHTWIEYQDKIIDTTLMLIIDKKFAKKLGYSEENRYDPNTDPIYRSAKEFATDTDYKNKKI